MILIENKIAKNILENEDKYILFHFESYDFLNKLTIKCSNSIEYNFHDIKIYKYLLTSNLNELNLIFSLNIKSNIANLFIINNPITPFYFLKHLYKESPKMMAQIIQHPNWIVKDFS